MSRRTFLSRRPARFALLLAVPLALGGGGLGLWGYVELRSSLPQLDGEAVLEGLGAPVTVARDGLGIPSIRGRDRLDVARATGYVHGQDRFFQMDLLRRTAAGELAELVGSAARGTDVQLRRHRHRHRARRAVENASAEERALVEAYTVGVNAALAATGKPFEYLLLRTEPRPWKQEDSYLVALSMFVQLQSSGPYYESTVGLIHDVLPEPLGRFLTPAGSSWDTPLFGAAIEAPPVPGPDEVDLRAQSGAAPSPRPPAEDAEPPLAAGSNSWAVAADHADGGAAMIANDMHLGLRVPNIWYRISLSWPDGDGEAEHRVTGVTLPGTPLVVVGSNTRVAWGFTNSEMDVTDLVLIEPDPDDEERYLTPEGSEAFDRHRETIRVLRGEDRVIEAPWTRWGPVFDTDHQGRRRALAWVAHRDGALDLGLVGLESAENVDEALDVAHRSGIPVQNFLVADAEGRIAWSLAGRLPRRVGFSGREPVSWADGTRFWDGWLAPEEIPSLVDPESGRLWTANNRILDPERLRGLGDSNFALGDRARQIRDRLFAAEKVSARDMLAIQLADRAPVLDFWRELLLESLSAEAEAADPRRRQARAVVEDWHGRAEVGSAGYRLVRAFRSALADEVFHPLTLACGRADPRFDYVSRFRQVEGPLRSLVTERPSHLLDPRYDRWEDQFAAALDKALDSLLAGGGRLDEKTWGERNTARISHALSGGLPAFARPWLDMPHDRLPGDVFSPRVQGPAFGASERMVVSPGKERDGLFHMPGGQSGHPLSPHYRDQHAAWVRGEPTPFLPGEPVHVLTLTPPG